MKAIQYLMMLCIISFSTLTLADTSGFDIESYLKSVNVPKGMEPERAAIRANHVGRVKVTTQVSPDIICTTSATGNPVFIARSQQAYFEGLSRTDYQNLTGPYVVAPSTNMGYAPYGGNMPMRCYQQQQQYNGCGSPNYNRGFPQLIYRYNPQPHRR